MIRQLKPYVELILSIKTGYSLVVVSFSIFGFLAYKGLLSDTRIAILSALMLLITPICVYLLRGEKPKLDSEILNLDLPFIIESIDLPIYVTDSKMKVIFANKELLSFLGVKQTEIIGKSINSLIDRFSELVPQDELENFKSEQDKTLKQGKSSPYAQLQTFVDTRKREVIKDGQLYQVHIHAQFINSPETKKELGSVVFYIPTPAE